MNPLPPIVHPVTVNSGANGAVSKSPLMTRFWAWIGNTLPVAKNKTEANHEKIHGLPAEIGMVRNSQPARIQTAYQNRAAESSQRLSRFTVISDLAKAIITSNRGL